MAGDKYIKNNSGQLTEVSATQTGGSGNENKIPALDSNGKFDTTMMPTGVVADTASILASENLAAGDLVNIYDNSGTANCRKADASAASAGKIAHGFVLSSVTSGQNALVYLEGLDTGQTGLTAGVLYLSGSTPGKATATAPSTSGYTVQRVGTAVSAASFDFNPSDSILLA